MSSNWSAPHSYSQKCLSSWKFGNQRLNIKAEQQGFSHPQYVSKKGLSLLFDPLVDAFLAAHLLAKGSFDKPSVIVLTDFYPHGRIIFPPNGSSDWALDEMISYLRGSHAPDYTIDNLLSALLKSKRSQFPHHKGLLLQESVFVKAIANRNVLVWNFDEALFSPYLQ